MVDVSKIQVGDEVTVCVKVLATEDIDGDFRLDGGRAGSWYVEKALIVGHTPKPREIKVGDTVTWGAKCTNWTVRAVYAGRAWADRDGLMVTVHVSDLVHA